MEKLSCKHNFCMTKGKFRYPNNKCLDIYI